MYFGLITEIELPYPPSTNKNYIPVAGGVGINKKGRLYTKARKILSKKGKEYKEIVAWTCKQQKIKQHQSNIKMDIFLSPPDKRIRDADNTIKALWDALQYAGAYKNDYQICEYHVKRLKPKGDGSVKVIIYDLGDEYDI